MWYIFFSGFFKSLKEQQLFKIDVFYKIIKVVVTFDQFNAYLLNKSIYFFKKIILTKTLDCAEIIL